MPLHWIIDSRTRLVTATVEGDCTRTDLEVYLKAVDGCGAVTWRKLFDGRHSPLSMDQSDMLAIGALFRSYHQRGPVGALALVVSETRTEQVSRAFGILAVADRPMRLFTDLDKARRWIDGLPA
ncbi:MAG: STAS/SEC14 domain-containing protein [Alphaproteobacteria bacterium]|jgi:hypothetical protein|nr:STAS/SEC14 domain-containing protein [Alphaproteobacteria bacterium]